MSALHVLSSISAAADVCVVWAVDGGSNAWGFASQDSDRDIKFIFVRRLRKYLKVEQGSLLVGETVNLHQSAVSTGSASASLNAQNSARCGCWMRDKGDVIEAGSGCDVRGNIVEPPESDNSSNEAVEAVGYDLPKALRLLRHGNASLFELLFLPQRVTLVGHGPEPVPEWQTMHEYSNEEYISESFSARNSGGSEQSVDSVSSAVRRILDTLRGVARIGASRRSIAHHHVSTVQKHLRAYFNGRVEVTLKKYFYIIRALLAAELLASIPFSVSEPGLFLPPADICQLLGAVERHCPSLLAPEQAFAIRDLIEQKRVSRLGSGPRIKVLDDFIEACFPHVVEAAKGLPFAPLPASEPFDDAFYEAVQLCEPIFGR